jgi:hypothetical protein
LHFAHVFRPEYPAFGHDQAPRRDPVEQIERRLQAGFERPQVAVVDPQERRLERERPVELHGIVHLHEYRHAQGARDIFELPHAPVFQGSRDQQYAVRSSGACFVHLVRIDREILAQNRKAACSPRRPEVRHRALKELLVGQHRQAGGAVTLIARSDRRGIELLPQHTPARARLLDLRDDRGPAGREFRAQRARKIAWRRRLPGLTLHYGCRPVALRARELLRLDREDTLQDIGQFRPACRGSGVPVGRIRAVHWVVSFLVNATNSSSFFRAAPLAITACALFTPSATVGARPAA